MNTNREIKIIVDRYRRELMQARPDRHGAILLRAEEDLASKIPAAQVRAAMMQLKTGQREAW